MGLLYAEVIEKSTLAVTVYFDATRPGYQPHCFVSNVMQSRITD
jgi:hypothetical protein